MIANFISSASSLPTNSSALESAISASESSIDALEKSSERLEPWIPIFSVVTAIGRTYSFGN